MNLFFADVLKERGELTEEQSDQLQRMLFPGLDDDPNKRLVESVKDMTRAYDKWTHKRSKKKETDNVKPMSDDEIDELANMMY
ncbi:MAG: hypothetical protein ACI3YI_13195 [Bacteroidaceae bacterium]